MIARKREHARAAVVVWALVALIVGTRGAPAQVACTTTIAAGAVFDQTWTAAGSPYCIAGDIRVSRVAIEPGVEVLFSGDFGVEVLAAFTVVGTSEAPVRFAAADPAAAR